MGHGTVKDRNQKMKTDTDDYPSRILQERCGKWTLVELNANRCLRVFDIAWGRDTGNRFDHITTNISPGPIEPHSIDFFYTSEITRITVPETAEILFVREQ